MRDKSQNPYKRTFMFYKGGYVGFFKVLCVNHAWLFDVKSPYKPIRRILSKMGNRQEKCRVWSHKRKAYGLG